MNVSFHNLVRFSCKQSSSLRENFWVAGLPADLFKFLLKEYLPFPDILNCALTCEVWCNRAKCITVGRYFLERASLQSKANETWMKTYSTWLNSNYLIVLDKSISMNDIPFAPFNGLYEPWRLETAIEKIKELALKLEPVISHKGIQVTLFAGSHVTKYVRNFHDLISFVEHPFDLENRHSNLFPVLEEIAHNHSIRITTLSTTVYVISDMDLLFNLHRLIPKVSTGLNFKFIQIGNSVKGVKLVEKLEWDYKNHVEFLKLDEGELEYIEAEIPHMFDKSELSTPPLVRKRTPDFELSIEKVSEKNLKLISKFVLIRKKESINYIDGLINIPKSIMALKKSL